MTDIKNVSNAYLNTLKNATGGAGETSAPVAGPSFGDILKSSLSSAAEAQHTSEKVSANALIGKADMTQVLQAVNDAEMALNTVLAIRDRVVNAFEQVMRTPI